MSDKVNYWAVIPAAGAGKRFGADRPKQYLTVDDKTILEYTIDCFIQRDDITGVVVAIAREDDYWPSLPISRHEKIIVALGGAERCQSVKNALQVLSEKANSEDWVLVHDAARPCLKQNAIDRLISELSEHHTGGILGLPCRDTMKRANQENEIIDTVDRNHLWHAQTPQMFRYQKLLDALVDADNRVEIVTDEAMAIELSGHQLKLVEGHSENIKITQKDDFEQAKIYLKWMI